MVQERAELPKPLPPPPPTSIRFQPKRNNLQRQPRRRLIRTFHPARNRAVMKKPLHLSLLSIQSPRPKSQHDSVGFTRNPRIPVSSRQSREIGRIHSDRPWLTAQKSPHNLEEGCPDLFHIPFSITPRASNPPRLPGEVLAVVQETGEQSAIGRIHSDRPSPREQKSPHDLKDAFCAFPASDHLRLAQDLECPEALGVRSQHSP